MLIVLSNQGFLFIIGIIFILIIPYNTQSIFRSLNVELTPYCVILNSTSVGNFFCTKHQSNSDTPFVISLSKNISNEHLNLSLNQLNQTTMHIQIHLRNYIGTFHLYCHLKGQSKQRTSADVIVNAKAGLIQLVERCHVYDKQYIKCIIQALTIARAIKNGFPEELEFTENANETSYKSQYEFLKNESTNEYLIFKWKPKIDEQFPDGVLMNMKIRLLYFGTSFHQFDMTPIFLTKPDFKLKQLPSYQIQLTLNSSSAKYCEANIIPITNIGTNQTQTVIESDLNTFIITDFLPNVTYQICTTCRHTLNSSYTIQACQEITTTYEPGSIVRILVPLIIILCLILIIISGFIYLKCFSKTQLVEAIPLEDIQPDERKSVSESSGVEENGEIDKSIIEITDEPVADAPGQGGYQPLYTPKLKHRFSVSSTYSND